MSTTADTRVAVIDIGSNSIKILVAQRGADGTLTALKMRTLDARISRGISQARPRLSEEGMTAGLEAIQTLLADAAPYQPGKIILVATSAVRDAENGEEFRQRVTAATGQTIRILSGEEEANLIGRGLTVDPALASLQDFYVFDLGGGSLECLAFRRRQRVAAISLPLGCVRLTERYVADPAQPVPDATLEAIRAATRSTLDASSFRFDLGAEGEAVFAGGTITTARTIFASQRGVTLHEVPARLQVEDLRILLTRLAALPLSERRTVPGLPPARADVFPAALVTTLAVAERARLTAFHHSLYNLRWGLAAVTLE